VQVNNRKLSTFIPSECDWREVCSDYGLDQCILYNTLAAPLMVMAWQHAPKFGWLIDLLESLLRPRALCAMPVDERTESKAVSEPIIKHPGALPKQSLAVTSRQYFEVSTAGPLVSSTVGHT